MKLFQRMFLLLALTFASSGFCQSVTIIHPEEGDFIRSDMLVFSFTVDGLDLLPPNSEIELWGHVGRDHNFWLACDSLSGEIEVLRPKPKQLCRLGRHDTMLVVAQDDNFPCISDQQSIWVDLKVDGAYVASDQIHIACEGNDY